MTLFSAWYILTQLVEQSAHESPTFPNSPLVVMLMLTVPATVSEQEVIESS